MLKRNLSAAWKPWKRCYFKWNTAYFLLVLRAHLKYFSFKPMFKDSIAVGIYAAKRIWVQRARRIRARWCTHTYPPTRALRGSRLSQNRMQLRESIRGKRPRVWNGVWACVRGWVCLKVLKACFRRFRTRRTGYIKAPCVSGDSTPAHKFSSAHRLLARSRVVRYRCRFKFAVQYVTVLALVETVVWHSLTWMDGCASRCPCLSVRLAEGGGFRENGDKAPSNQKTSELKFFRPLWCVKVWTLEGREVTWSSNRHLTVD